MRPTRRRQRRQGDVYLREITREIARDLAATNRRYRHGNVYASMPNYTPEELQREEDLILAAELAEMTDFGDDARLRRQQSSISEDLDSLGRYNPGVS